MDHWELPQLLKRRMIRKAKRQTARSSHIISNRDDTGLGSSIAVDPFSMDSQSTVVLESDEQKQYQDEDDENENENRRRMDEVKKISDTECLFTSSLVTKYGGSTFAVGTMFTLVPGSDVDILALEFNAQIDASVPTKVYYKEGDFSGSTSDASQWTLLADTTAQIAPGGADDNEEDGGAIIPIQDFTPASLSAGTKYSFYVHVEGGSSILKVQTNDTALVGDDFFTDNLGIITLQTGVSLNDGPFPSSFGDPVQFAGRLHHRSTQNCDATRTSTVVEFQFAVNAEPVDSVMSALSDAVQKSIEAVIVLDTDLLQYQKFQSLEINYVQSAFMGRSGTYHAAKTTQSTITICHVLTHH